MAIIIFLVWLISAYVCSSMARNKGHDPLTWGLIGFFVGPLAILFIAIASEREERNEPMNTSVGSKQCYRCAELIRAEANACRYCGAEFDIEDTQNIIASLQFDKGQIEIEREAEQDRIHQRNLTITGLVFGIPFIALMAIIAIFNI